jgi:hypothetical protein
MKSIVAEFFQCMTAMVIIPADQDSGNGVNQIIERRYE